MLCSAFFFNIMIIVIEYRIEIVKKIQNLENKAYICKLKNFNLCDSSKCLLFLQYIAQSLWTILNDDYSKIKNV